MMHHISFFFLCYNMCHQRTQSCLVRFYASYEIAEILNYENRRVRIITILLKEKSIWWKDIGLPTENDKWRSKLWTQMLSRCHLQCSPQSAGWQKPRRGRVKCNIDASFSTSMNRCGIGISIRDKEGQLVCAKTLWFSLMCSVDVGEALGLYHAMWWANE